MHVVLHSASRLRGFHRAERDTHHTHADSARDVAAGYGAAHPSASAAIEKERLHEMCVRVDVVCLTTASRKRGGAERQLRAQQLSRRDRRHDAQHKHVDRVPAPQGRAGELGLGLRRAGSRPDLGRSRPDLGGPPDHRAKRLEQQPRQQPAPERECALLFTAPPGVKRRRREPKPRPIPERG